MRAPCIPSPTAARNDKRVTALSHDPSDGNSSLGCCRPGSRTSAIAQGGNPPCATSELWCPSELDGCHAIELMAAGRA
jgi:hypothetical protein